MLGVFLAADKKISGGKALHRLNHVVEPFAIGNTIALGIYYAVATNIGQAIGRVWIGPPVRCNAQIVMLVAARRVDCFVRDRVDGDVQRAIRVPS